MSGTIPVQFIPDRAIPPRPCAATRAALRHMETALVAAGYIPHVDASAQTIDAHLYLHRTWTHGRPTGTGVPVAAVCLCLDGPAMGPVQWLVEYPARGPEEIHETTEHRQLTVLGNATAPPRAADLGLVDYLVHHAPGRCR